MAPSRWLALADGTDRPDGCTQLEAVADTDSVHAATCAWERQELGYHPWKHRNLGHLPDRDQGVEQVVPDVGMVVDLAVAGLGVVVAPAFCGLGHWGGDVALDRDENVAEKDAQDDSLEVLGVGNEVRYVEEGHHTAPPFAVDV